MSMKLYNGFYSACCCLVFRETFDLLYWRPTSLECGRIPFGDGILLEKMNLLNPMNLLNLNTCTGMYAYEELHLLGRAA